MSLSLGFGYGKFKEPPVGYPAILSLLLTSYDLRLVLNLCASLLLFKMVLTRLLQRLIGRGKPRHVNPPAVVYPLVILQQTTHGIPSSHPPHPTLILYLSLD